MTVGPLLTTSPLPTTDGWAGWTVQPASTGALLHAVGLLVPHDGQPVRNVQHRPDRWALLTLVSGAVRRGLPVLAWGTGAALAGRVLGAAIHTGIQGEGGQMEGEENTAEEWAALPRTAHAERWLAEAPLLWRAGAVTAWAGEILPAALKLEFLTRLKTPTPRMPATPLEHLGGEEILRPLLADFYARARADTALGPVFAAHVSDWEAHLEAVTAFWITMLGGQAQSGGPPWRGNLNHIHAPLGVRGVHLARWLTLFRAAAEAHLSPDAAQLLVSRAEAMGARLGQKRAGASAHSH
ncbi:group III truncated hemoglobin [Deinococcus oregonensis]|uniref:Group III truncated hemoglobin n=1 Tax=Deinococcus oregonensis TaxID=1805970 RepID=A0ABV6AZ35_9DEIO